MPFPFDETPARANDPATEREHQLLRARHDREAMERATKRPYPVSADEQVLIARESAHVAYKMAVDAASVVRDAARARATTQAARDAAAAAFTQAVEHAAAERDAALAEAEAMK